jgi:ABC-type glycerol-3-phosphate transport system permease component
MSIKTLPVYILLAIVFLFAALPMIWLFLASFDPAATQATKIPGDIVLSNFLKALSGRSLRWHILFPD